MSRNDLDMSSGEPLILDLDSQPREATRESGPPRNRPSATISNQYSPLNRTVDTASSNDSTFQTQEPKAADKSTETIVQGLAFSPSELTKKTLDDPERPKKICSDSTLSALRHLALFHLPAMAITLTLLSLYIARIRWGYLSAEQLSIFQFAAKGHEVLILISLTDIMLHRVCYSLLVDDDGVPLGFISSPFQLGSPVQYLFSWELWAVLLRPGPRGRPRITGAVMVILIAISIAAAPLSAIAMMPRQGWWQVHTQPKPIEIVTYLQDQLYETDFGNNSKSIEFYQDFLGWNDPVENPLALLIPTIANPPYSDGTSTVRHMANFTYSSYDFTAEERLVSLTRDFSSGSLGIAVATCPMSKVAAELGESWSSMPKDLLIKSERKTLDSPSPRRWKQPLVAVECAENITTGTTASFSFTANLSDTNVVLDADDDAGFNTLLKAARRDKGKMPKVGYYFPGLPDGASPLSTQILFVTHVAEYRGGELRQGEVEGSVTLQLCQIYARWADADVWIEREKSSIAQSQMDFSLFDLYDYFGDSPVAGDTIRMRDEWMIGISQPEFYGSEKRPISRYQQILDFCTINSLSPAGGCLDIAMASHMVDALSQTESTLSYADRGEKQGHGLDWPDEPPPTPSDTIVHHTYYIGGYGYILQSSRTIPLALSVLLLHVYIVLIHVLVTLLPSRRPWHSSGWSSFGELLVLALRSRVPDEMGSVGGGVESSQTWNRAASVRVVGEEGRLEIVLLRRREGDGESREFQNGVGEGYCTGLGQVKPGIKYY
ncbi:hypothetical protein ACJZ2D_000731 [Fusarium nematophilum]